MVSSLCAVIVCVGVSSPRQLPGATAPNVRATTSAERSKADNELAYLEQLERETTERLDAGPYARPATWE